MAASPCRAAAAQWGVALVALELFGACSSAKGPKFADANAYCNARGQAECNHDVITACAAADDTHCVASRQAACIAEVPVGTSYNADAAEPCVNAVSDAYGDAKVTLDEHKNVIDMCKLVFDGPGIANAACQTDTDCKVSTGLRCVQTGGQAVGTCQMPQLVQGGGSCAAASQLCAPGFHCGSSQHCDVDSMVNESCSSAIPCDASSSCVAGTCNKKFDDGTACAMDLECLHGLCARGSGEAQGLCTSQLILAPNEPFCRDARSAQ